jgi:hypothetical protein
LKGIIYYREDTKQNVSCYYDFRNTVRDILGTKTFTDYSTVYNFKLGPLFVGQVGTIISNNVFGSNSKNNLIGSNFYNNVVGSNFQNNEIHDNTCNSINFSGATLVYQPFNKTITSMYSVSLGTAVKLWYLDADSNLPIFANITD